MGRRQLVFWLVFWGSLLFFGDTWAKVRIVEVYRNGVFLEEVFSLNPGENTIYLKSLVDPKQIQIKSKGVEILSLLVQTGLPEGGIFQKFQELTKEQQRLINQEKLLAQELEILEASLKNKTQALDPTSFQQYLNLYEQLYQKKIEIQRKKQKIEEELNSLQEVLPKKGVSILKILARNKGFIHVYYPVSNILNIDETYRVTLRTKEKAVLFQAQATILQRSGENWEGVSLRFYPRTKKMALVSPPPFEPWYVDYLVRNLKIRNADKGRNVFPKKAFRPSASKAPPIPEREIQEFGLWERVVVEGVNLPNGKKTVIPLTKEKIPLQRLCLEVPAYSLSKAFFRADFVPQISIPQTEAMFYLDEVYVGKDTLGPFYPKKEAKLYFGEAPLLEVKREVLKDTTGHPFFSLGKEVIEKVYRTTLINHYKKTFLVELIDRRPLAQRKETKIEVQADPPWNEETPKGRLIWKFKLPPGGKARVTLAIKINRKVD